MPVTEVALGTLTLQPRRQLLADGAAVPLGPKPLNILSVLADAGGALVTKHDLMDQIWPGLIVEENALQAHITALRKALGPEAGRLRTHRGVGYRLELDTAEAAASATIPRAQFPGSSITAPSFSSGAKVLRGSRGISVALAAGLGAIALGRAVTEAGPPPSEIVWVDGLRGTGGVRADRLATTLHGEIVDRLSQSGIQTGSGDRAASSAAASQPNLRLRGSVTQSGQRLVVHLLFEDVLSGTILWSRQFEGSVGSERTVATEASVAAARTMYTVGELKLQRDLELDPATIALHIRGSELVRSAQSLEPGTPRRIFEQFVSQAPESAHGHAVLAVALTNEARRGSPDDRAQLLAAARKEAAKAIAIDRAGAGAAYDALYLMSRTEHPRQFARAESWILEGLRFASDFPFLPMRECRFLSEIGRAREALAYCQRALALHPYAEPIGHSYARALSMAGNPALSDEVIERSARFNPDHRVTRAVRFELAAFGGHADRALRLLDTPSIGPIDMSPEGSALMKRYLQGGGAWPAGERALLATQFEALGRDGRLYLDWAVMALASLGHNDQAFELLASDRVNETLFMVGSAFLFQPVTKPLRSDPRFWRAAAELGLVQYWVKRGKWPDICHSQFDVAYCQNEAAKALAPYRQASQS